MLLLLQPPADRFEAAFESWRSRFQDEVLGDVTSFVNERKREQQELDALEGLKACVYQSSVPLAAVRLDHRHYHPIPEELEGTAQVMFVGSPLFESRPTASVLCASGFAMRAAVSLVRERFNGGARVVLFWYSSRIVSRAFIYLISVVVAQTMSRSSLRISGGALRRRIRLCADF